MKRSILPALCLALAAVCGPGSRAVAQSATPPPGSAPRPVNPAAELSTNSPVTIPVPVVPTLPPPVNEVVQLIRRGLGEAVVLDFIAKIQEPYSLNADQLIYLNDLGISGPVLQALLKQSGTAPAAPTATQNVVIQGAAVPVAPNTPITTQTPESGAPASNVLLNPYLASTASAPGPAGQPAQSTVGTAPEAPAGTPTMAVPVQPTVVSRQIFYESLSPYGTWVEVPSYGWCWQPTVAIANPAWIPYGDGGRWAWTDSGWYWHSSYTWGWGPYHYGRWQRHSRHGWVWMPGYDWAPAWVAWRSTPSYCGWAPLPPECHWTTGVGFSWVNGRSSVSVGFGIGYDWWFATSWNRFCDPVRPAHRLPPHGIRQFVQDSHVSVGGGGQGVNIRGNNNTVIINNNISREEVQRHTRDEIRRTEIRDVGSPAAAHAFASSRPSPSSGRPTELAVYRPSIPTQAAKPSPSVLNRQETARPTVLRPGTSSFTPSGSPSRPLPVPSANGSSSLNGSRPSVSGTSRPAPAPITGLNSTKPSPGNPPSISTAPPGRPSNFAAPATPSRGEISRPSPSGSAPVPPVTSIAPSVAPSVSTRPAPASSTPQFRATPTPSFNPPQSKPQYRQAPPPLSKPAFQPSAKPSPGPSTESFRPAPSAPAGPSYRPAPSPSPSPSGGHSPGPSPGGRKQSEP